MRVNELSPEMVQEGVTRIEVTHIEVGKAEHIGFVNDTKRLLGATGTVAYLNHGGSFPQLWVEWDDKSPEGPGSLMLCGEDQVRLIAAGKSS